MRNWIRRLAALLIAVLLTAALPVAAFAEDGDKETQELDPCIEAALEWGLWIAQDNSHGYSQAYRFGPNYDCSSFVSAALIHGGFKMNYVSTYGMKETLEDLGFEVYRKGEVSLQRGDIMLNPWQHVEFYLGNGQCLAAHMDYDGRSGDSTGKEINIREGVHCAFCRNKTYVYILRCPAPKPEPEPEPETVFEPKPIPVPEPVFIHTVEEMEEAPFYPLLDYVPGAAQEPAKVVSVQSPENAMKQ